MALNIRNRRTEELPEVLARLSGEIRTEAVTRALRDRLERVRRHRGGRCLARELDDIALHCACFPVLDNGEPEEILGYEDDGLPA